MRPDVGPYRSKIHCQPEGRYAMADISKYTDKEIKDCTLFLEMLTSLESQSRIHIGNVDCLYLQIHPIDDDIFKPHVKIDWCGPCGRYQHEHEVCKERT